jgi:hypothetical protein
MITILIMRIAAKTALASLKKGEISKATPLAWLPGNPSNAVAPLFKGIGGSECVSPELPLVVKPAA